MPPPNLDYEEEFFSRLDKMPNGCWLWKGAITGRGYPVMHLTKGKWVKAHRWAYEHFVGPIPEGLEPDHTCEIKICVNPDHIEPVTHLENVRRGPVGRGETGAKISATRKRMIADGELVHDGLSWVRA